MKKIVLIAIAAMVVMIVAASASIGWDCSGSCDYSGYGKKIPSVTKIHKPFIHKTAIQDNCAIYRDTDLEEKIFDKVVHDHGLDSRKALAFSKVIESEKLDLKDRLILNSVDKHDFSIGKRILFSKLLNENEVFLKKQLLYNAQHEFDHHNFHDFDHDLHLGSGFDFEDVLETSCAFGGQGHDGHGAVMKDTTKCLNIWTRSNLLQKVCDDP